MGSSVVYWRHFKLGDFLVKRSSPVPQTEAPNEIPGLGAGRVFVYNATTAGRMEIPVRVGMSKTAAESQLVFWRRTRVFAETLLDQATTWNGPLCVIRDPLGEQYGDFDTTETTAPFTAGSGTMSLDGVTAAWTVGDRVLIIDDIAPTTLFEVATLTGVNAGANTIDLTTSNSYTSQSQVHRCESVYPNAYITQNLVWDEKDDEDRSEFLAGNIIFHSTAETLEGAATS